MSEKKINRIEKEISNIQRQLIDITNNLQKQMKQINVEAIINHENEINLRGAIKNLQKQIDENRLMVSELREHEIKLKKEIKDLRAGFVEYVITSNKQINILSEKLGIKWVDKDV